MNKLRKNRSFLISLCANPSLIEKASLGELSTVVEILYNLGNIPFTQKEKRLIAKHLSIIREIAKCSRERKARAKLVQYGGGFLSTLIPAAIALLAAAGARQ